MSTILNSELLSVICLLWCFMTSQF